MSQTTINRNNGYIESKLERRISYYEYMNTNGRIVQLLEQPCPDIFDLRKTQALEPIFGDIDMVQRMACQNRIKYLYDLLHSYLCYQMLLIVFFLPAISQHFDMFSNPFIGFFIGTAFKLNSSSIRILVNGDAMI